MMHDGARSRGGAMPNELQDEVDRLLDEFMAEIDTISQDRHLQKAIVRSQLPCDMLAVVDKDNLYVVAQLRSENRTSTYIYNPEASWTPQKVLNSAQWEFRFTDPFLIQFPASLVAEKNERHEALRKIASDHIDSEFTRFMGLLSLLRTRPIFGPATSASSPEMALLLLLLPTPDKPDKNSQAITQAAETEGLTSVLAEDIRRGKSAVREMWASINEARIVIADLTGPDPSVMYGLGIAHTVGKETILICPQGSEYLAGIPKTHRIEYEDSDSGRMKLQQALSEKLRVLTEPMEKI
jgi:hypothetical protein